MHSRYLVTFSLTPLTRDQVTEQAATISNQSSHAAEQALMLTTQQKMIMEQHTKLSLQVRIHPQVCLHAFLLDQQLTNFVQRWLCIEAGPCHRLFTYCVILPAGGGD